MKHTDEFAQTRLLFLATIGADGAPHGRHLVYDPPCDEDPTTSLLVDAALSFTAQLKDLRRRMDALESTLSRLAAIIPAAPIVSDGDRSPPDVAPRSTMP